MTGQYADHPARKSLYTPDQKQRRDTTPWTLVQGVLAPLQFLVFLISVGLVFHYLASGDGYALASWSIVVKTGFLYLIMITGAIWEKVVFDQWLFAPAFFWEDVFSFAVIALHTLYIYGLFWAGLPPMTLMIIALAAYAAYLINAGQFIWKLRTARRQAEAMA